MNHDQSSEKPNDYETTGPNESKGASKKKIKKELSVMSLPHDNDVMAQEMADLFDEDRVTHKHGNAEPEKD